MPKEFVAVSIVSDESGHDYMIPSEQVSNFYIVLGDGENNDNYDVFEETFGKFKIEGDHPQLYITQGDFDSF